MKLTNNLLNNQNYMSGSDSKSSFLFSQQFFIDGRLCLSKLGFIFVGALIVLFILEISPPFLSILSFGFFILLCNFFLGNGHGHKHYLAIQLNIAGRELSQVFNLETKGIGIINPGSNNMLVLYALKNNQFQ